MSRLVLLGAALVCATMVAGLAAAGHLERLTKPGLLILVIAPSAAAVTLTYVALWQPDRVARWRGVRVGRRLARELSLLGVSLIAVETLLAIWVPDTQSPQLIRKSAADKLGLPFDTRTHSEVVAQLRDDGVDALPGSSRDWPLSSFVHARLPAGFYPLSHASNASIVECNERGEYLVYQTDEFGFNNPRGLLAQNRLGIAAVGESYTLGHCVPHEHSLIGLLRKVYPRTANFAMAGGASLSQLASFREYVEPLRPPVVLWMVNWTSIVNEDELNDPVLTRYLDPTFSQHLRERQSEVDRVLRTLAIPAQAERDRAARLAIERAEARRFMDIPFIPRLRDRQYIGFWRSAARPDLRLFVQIVTLANETTQRWGGNFILVILPSYAEVVRATKSPLRNERMMRVLTDRGISVIDGLPPFLSQRDPAGLYPMRIQNHPTPEANALLADHLVQELERRWRHRLADLR
jgi:hypothetical protein